MFQENVKFPQLFNTITFSHQYVAISINNANESQKKYSFKRKHFSAGRNCDNSTQICFQDKLLKSIFNLSVGVDI